jgi:aldose 1-epimerase
MEKLKFGTLSDGKSVEKLILKSKSGMVGEFLTYGCRITRLMTANRKGQLENVILGHDTLAEYEAPGDVHGAVIGRFANRIAGGEFTADGKKYHLEQNEGSNTLHSASSGFQNRIWNIKEIKDGAEPYVTFSLLSPDGDGGFPGNLQVEVTYTLTEDNALRIDYRAETDAETPLNLTNHSYFNLTGHAEKDILGHMLQVYADGITQADDGLIPTGSILPVEGTPYDFRTSKPIGQDIQASEPFLAQCGGYDVNFVLRNANGLRKAAELYDPESGRVMQVYTDLPGLQVYTANSFPAGSTGHGGVPFKPHHAVCLETQFFPDAVHHPQFPYSNLKPNHSFHSATEFRFHCK